MGYSAFRWTGEKLQDLRRWYATTENKELADILGCAVSSLTAKAGQLGLRKNPEWMRRKRREWAINMQIGNRRAGNPGAFKPGHQRSKATQFKPGHTLNNELEEKRRAGLRRYWVINRDNRRTSALEKLGRPVRCVTTGQVFPGVRAAARSLNIPSCGIFGAIKRGGTTHGLTFAFI